MRKIGIAVLMVILTGMMLFAGGGQSASNTSASNTITVWCWDPNFNIYAINEAAKIYSRSNPAAKVNVVETPWDDLQQKLITAFSARQTAGLPDIILMQDNAIQKNIMTYPDAFLPVNGKVDISQFAQFKLDKGSYNGRNYGVPFDNGATATFLRRDIIEQAGLQVSDFNDITWERFIELGKVVKDRTGIPLLSTNAAGLDLIMIMLQSANSWFFDAQGKTFIRDNPILRKSLELFVEGVQAGVFLLASDWNNYIATLNNGTAASTIQGCWIIGSIVPEISQSGKWTVVSTPRFATINSVNYSSQGGSGWMVLSSSKNPDLAMDFLNKTFAGSVELYETILPSSGAIATWLPAANSTVYSQPHPFFGGQKIYEVLVSYAAKVPNVKYGIYNYEARTAVTRGFVDIVQGRTTIQAALNEAQNEVDFIMSQ